MKILFLSQRFLFPMDTGGKIRTGNILRELSRQHEVVVVGNFDPEEDAQHLARMDELCSRFVGVEWKEPRRNSLGFYWRVFRHTFSSYPVTVKNDYSVRLEQKLLDVLEAEDFDIAVCDFVQSALLFRRVSGVPTLLFEHNVEAEILLRHVKQATNFVARTFWSAQYRRMQRFESNVLANFDAVVAVSERDAQKLEEMSGHQQVRAIPTGVDLDFYQPDKSGAESSTELVFCGSMDWLPNEDGIAYFLESIGPELDRLEVDWHLTVVGRKPSPALIRAAEKEQRLHLTGWVDDIRPHVHRAAISIVPLRIGGGTRMKIYEAMALGVPVISTSVGAEGLDSVDGQHIVLVDEPASFALAIKRLLGAPDERQRIAEAARALVEQEFGWASVARCFAEMCENAVEQRASR